MKVVTIFIDGLKPESLQYMRFVSKLPFSRRIRSKLGYSNTAHASMYSGVRSNKHQYWFTMNFSKSSSPFRWIRTCKLDKISDNWLYKYFLYRVTVFLYGKHYSAFWSIPYLWYIPLPNWHYFDVSEKKFWTEDNFIEGYETIFELLRKDSVEYNVIGLDKTRASRSSEIVKNYIDSGKLDQTKEWNYIFFGDIDPLSHRNGQSADITIKKLEEIDTIVESIYLRYWDACNEDFCFILFSDHGHLDVNEKINPYNIFESLEYSLHDYVHFVDSNYLRFWFRNATEKEEVLAALEGFKSFGFILDQETLSKYHMDMPDNRYGDLIFYLDAPNVFDKGCISFAGQKITSDTKSMHGYLPDNSEMDGVFISNHEISKGPYIELEDITPSILHKLKIKTPGYMDGEVIWE